MSVLDIVGGWGARLLRRSLERLPEEHRRTGVQLRGGLPKGLQAGGSGRGVGGVPG